MYYRPIILPHASTVGGIEGAVNTVSILETSKLYAVNKR